MENKKNHNTNFNLDDLPRQNNFKIPENYFEGLASSLENELKVNNAPKKRGIVKNLVINVSIAAAVVVGIFLFKPDNKPESKSYEVSQSEEVYVEAYLISMVESTEEWTPFEEFDVDVNVNINLESVSDEDVNYFESVTAGDLLDYFEDEDYYEL